MSESPKTTFATELATHEPLVLRAALLGTALICWNAATMIWEGGSCASSSLSTMLMLGSYLAGFGMLLGVALRHPPMPFRWAIPLGLALVCACYAQNHHIAQLENGVLTTDVRLYMDHAARLLRHGENPYEANLLEAYRLNRAPFNFSTPLLDGDLTGRVAYPALSILIFVPFQWIGLPAAWAYPLLLLLAMVLLYRWSPRAAQPLILLPLFIDPRYLLYTLGGVSDIVWALLLVVMLRFWSSQRQRGIWYGLACAFKHQPWLLGPFLLVRLWHDQPPAATRNARLRSLAVFVGWAALGFGLVNLPFLLWSPTAWFAGVFEPVVAPMITFGQGLSALTMFGRVVIPKTLFTVFLLLALGVSLYAYARHHDRLRLLLWIAPGFALWLSHRSLTSYWYFFLLPLLYDLVMRPPATVDEPATAVQRALPWRPVAIASTLGLLTIVGATLLLGSLPDVIELRVGRPLTTDGTHVSRLRIDVRNRSRKRLQPRFAVQSRGLQPFFWRIARGPRFLRKGERASYEIEGDAPFSRFELRRGARITVSHAGSQALRSTAQVPPDHSYVYPDSIPNGRYGAWPRHGVAPTFWGLVRSAPEHRLRLAPSGASQRFGYHLVFDLAAGGRPAEIALDTYLALPYAKINIDLWVPRDANVLPKPQLLYGLRVVAGAWRGLVLFGDRAEVGKLPNGTPYAMVQAPRGRWSHHALDLPKLLSSIGAPLLPTRKKLPRFEHLDFPLVAINFQLYVARPSGVTAPLPVATRFGPVTTRQRPAVAQLYRRLHAQRAALPLWRGQYNFEMRNYRVARRAFERATKLAPKEPTPWRLLGEAEFWLGRWRPAIKAFATSLRFGKPHALAYKGIGWAHYNVGELEEALLAWSSAVKLLERRADDRGHLVDTLKGMAMAYVQQGRCERAKATVTKARKLDTAFSLPPKLLQRCQGGSPP